MPKKLIYSALGFIFMSALAVSMFLYAEIKPFDLLIALFISFKKFILGLTLLKVVGLGVKRYFIDHVISKNLQEHFFCHIKLPLKTWWSKVDLTSRLVFFIPASVLTAISVYIAGFNNVLTALGIKAFVIGFFKTLWVLSSKVFYFFTVYIWDSWFAPIVEVFILSWLLKLLEKIPYLDGMFKKIYQFNGKILHFIGDWLDRLVHFPVQRKLNAMGKWLANYIEEKNNR